MLFERAREKGNRREACLRGNLGDIKFAFRIMVALCMTILTRLADCFDSSGALPNMASGPEIMVSGLRNSCEILAKKSMFILLTCCSCCRSRDAQLTFECQSFKLAKLITKESDYTSVFTLYHTSSSR